MRFGKSRIKLSTEAVSVPAIKKDPDVITSSYDKERLFKINFAFNYTSDDKDHPLANFSTSSRSTNILISLSGHEKFPILSKASILRRPSVQTKPQSLCLSLKLSSILAKHSNRCLNMIPMVVTVCPILMNMTSCLSLRTQSQWHLVCI